MGRRVAPPPLEQAETWLELPSPAEPDVLALVARLRPADVQRELQGITGDLQREAALEEPVATALQDLVTRYPASNGAVENYRAFDGDVQRLLGTDRYEQYRRTLNRRFEALLMAPRRPHAEGSRYD